MTVAEKLFVTSVKNGLVFLRQPALDQSVFKFWNTLSRITKSAANEGDVFLRQEVAGSVQQLSFFQRIMETLRFGWQKWCGKFEEVATRFKEAIKPPVATPAPKKVKPVKSAESVPAKTDSPKSTKAKGETGNTKANKASAHSPDGKKPVTAPTPPKAVEPLAGLPTLPPVIKPGRHLADTTGLMADFGEIQYRAGFNGGIIGDDWYAISLSAHPDEALMAFLNKYRGHQLEHGVRAKLGKKTIDEVLEPILEKHGILTIKPAQSSTLDKALHEVTSTTYTSDPDFIGKVHAVKNLGFSGPNGVITRPQVSVFAKPPVSDTPQAVEKLFLEFQEHHGLKGSEQFIPNLDKTTLDAVDKRMFRRGILKTTDLDKLIVPMDPAKVPTTVYHGTQAWSVKAIKDHGFDVLQPVQNGHTLDVGQGVYMALSEGGAGRYGSTIVKAAPQVSKTAKLTNAEQWHNFRNLFVETASDFVRHKGLPKTLEAPLADRMLREFFERQGYDSVYTAMSGKAGIGYLAVFDPKKLQILETFTQAAS